MQIRSFPAFAYLWTDSKSRQPCVYHRGWVTIARPHGQDPGTGAVYWGFSADQEKNGSEIVGLFTEWLWDGQKSSEGIYINGKYDGLWLIWHDNGGKKEEKKYKDGELISKECWDKYGTPEACN